jgi:hypothetical protein
LNKKSIANYEQQLFQSELEKYRPHQNRLVQATHKQAALMKELTVTFNNLLQDKRVRAEQSKYEAVQRQRSSVINRYKRAYQEFLDLEAGLQSAKNWYKEMRETVHSLEKNVETFINNRRSEGAQLLNQIEQERAANKSAEASREQERLRGLMERMSMEPPGSPANKPPSSRTTPAPLSFSPGPGAAYPRQNFAGQYQMPSSPPPTQTTAPQSYTPQLAQGYSSYNPSSLGRIPGPASPPPTQTAFNMGYRQGPASPSPNQTSFNPGVQQRLGPASPPPTRTSFSQQTPQPYNTYGNPAGIQQQPLQQQQQQQPMPAGFVPPPPPPGPPPLGPQQTFHYNNNDYYINNNPQIVRSPSAQAQQTQGDPWAGLNAWK